MDQIILKTINELIKLLKINNFKHSQIAAKYLKRAIEMEIEDKLKKDSKSS